MKISADFDEKFILFFHFHFPFFQQFLLNGVLLNFPHKFYFFLCFSNQFYIAPCILQYFHPQVDLTITESSMKKGGGESPK